VLHCTATSDNLLLFFSLKKEGKSNGTRSVIEGELSFSTPILASAVNRWPARPRGWSPGSAEGQQQQQQHILDGRV